MDIQTERAYLKQDAVFENRKATLGKKKGGSLRYVRNVGLGFKTPSEVNLVVLSVRLFPLTCSGLGFRPFTATTSTRSAPSLATSASAAASSLESFSR